jgi:hypothetical protein
VEEESKWKVEMVRFLIDRSSDKASAMRQLEEMAKLNGWASMLEALEQLRKEGV